MNKLLRDTKLSPADIDIVGYDGQTIYQEPPEREKMAAVQDQDSLVDLWTDGGYPCGLFIAESGVVAGMFLRSDLCLYLHHIIVLFVSPPPPLGQNAK